MENSISVDENQDCRPKYGIVAEILEITGVLNGDMASEDQKAGYK